MFKYLIDYLIDYLIIQWLNKNVTGANTNGNIQEKNLKKKLIILNIFNVQNAGQQLN
jgi:hypothetical protein